MTDFSMMLAALTADTNDPPVLPHHPLTCASEPIRYHEDGTMECPHATTWPHDPRARAAVCHSVAKLIVQMAAEL